MNRGLHCLLVDVVIWFVCFLFLLVFYDLYLLSWGISLSSLRTDLA